jgi:hypothetical protein
MAHAEGPWRRPVSEEISSFADVHAPGRYHETLTRFWVKLVSHTCSADAADADFQSQLARFLVLLDKHAPQKHYSSAVLGSPDARSSYVEPDLRPMP